MLHDMGRIDIRTAAGGFQDVSRKWWNPPCRSCLLASAASSDFYNSVASAMRSGLVSTSMPRFLEAGGLLHGKISGQKRDCLERQGLLLFPDSEVVNRVADMGTPIVRMHGHQLYRQHLFHFKSSTELCRACCDLRHLVKLF